MIADAEEEADRVLCERKQKFLQQHGIMAEGGPYMYPSVACPDSAERLPVGGRAGAI